MRGKKIKVRARLTINSLAHIFKEGDELWIQSILLDKPKLIHNELSFICDKDGNVNKFIKPRYIKELEGNKVGEIVKLKSGDYGFITSAKVYAPIGSYDDYVLITKDLREYCGSHTTPYSIEELFEKI
jgi:hypothetical protein